MFIPKRGGTPRRNEIIFTSPTGDTPRHFTRLSSKPKATETPEGGSSQKRQRRSSSKKVKEKTEDTDGEGEDAEDEVAAKEAEDGMEWK
ncbi:hypothetical protein Ancab_038692 [Ancistrocladus abbreviatus]